MIAEIELKGILEEVHANTTCGESKHVCGLRKRAHEVVWNSNLTYWEVYSLFKEYTKTDAEFNAVMGRIRKTMVDNGMVG